MRYLSLSLSLILFILVFVGQSLADEEKSTQVNETESSEVLFGLDWKELCREDLVQPSVYLEHFDWLAVKLENSLEWKEKCPQKYHQSIEDLGHLLELALSEDVCRSDTLNQLRKFHLDYIATNAKGPGSIPTNLAAYYLMLAEALTSECLSSVWDDLMEWNLKLKLPSKLESAIIRYAFDEKAFQPFFDAFNILELIDLDQRVKVALPPKSVFRQVQEICEARLRPMYEFALVPVLHLLRLGYYVAPTVDMYYRFPDPKPTDYRDIIRERWIHVVQICESLKNIELLVIPRESNFTHWGLIEEDEVAREAAERSIREADYRINKVDPLRLPRKPQRLETKVSHVVPPKDLKSLLVFHNQLLEQFSSKLRENEAQQERAKILVSLFLEGMLQFI